MKLTDENLITEIISRVAAKDLMRFMSVSKSWRSLIDSDSYLASLQLQRTVSTALPCLVFMPHNRNISLDLEDQNNQITEIHDPFHDDKKRGDLIDFGSCHGLLVLGHDDHTVVVSNPTTKKYHVVPPNPVSAIIIGFGYDNRRCCYKLVTMVEPALSGDHVIELMTYDVNGARNQWRKSRFDLLELMINVSDNEWIYPFGAYVDGALYWYLESKSMILGFDLAEDKFFKTALPDFGDVVHKDIWIKVFDDHLCLLCDRNNRRNKVDFWVMDKKFDDGPSNWTKFLTMTPPGRDKVWHACGDPRLFPVCFSSCRNKILFEVYAQELWWYEPKIKEFRKLKTPLLRKGTCVPNKTSCIRSLIGNGIF